MTMNTEKLQKLIKLLSSPNNGEREKHIECTGLFIEMSFGMTEYFPYDKYDEVILNRTCILMQSLGPHHLSRP